MQPDTDIELTRANTFAIAPKAHWRKVCLLELLNSAATLVNVVTYHRRQAYIEHRTRRSVWTAIRKGDIRNCFQPDLGRAITDKMLDKCDEIWTGYFETLDKYKDPDDDTTTEKPTLPGYWKENGQRVLHACIRNDAYEVVWNEDDESYIELALGSQRKEKYGIALNQRLRVRVKGNPHWDGHQGRLELSYDRSTESFTARQPVTTIRETVSVPSPSRAADSGDEECVAAVDVGANNLVAVTTTTGHQRLYHGRPMFERFHEITEQIAHLQSLLDDEQDSSKRIESLYATRSAQRDHAQDALVRDLAEWLGMLQTTDVYVGELDDVLESHWSALVNEKNHLFWAHGRFRRRLTEVCEEYGIEVHEESEAGTSSQCPSCGEDERVSRTSDVFTCGACAFEGHSDLVGSENFLRDVVDRDVDEDDGLMAQPLASGQNSPRGGHQSVPRLQWNDHEWTAKHSGRSTNEESRNQCLREETLPSTSAEPTHH